MTAATEPQMDGSRKGAYGLERIDPGWAKAAPALAAVLVLAGCVPVPSVVGHPAAVLGEGEHAGGIAPGLVFGTESTPGEQTDQDLIAGPACILVDYGLGCRSDLTVMLDPTLVAGQFPPGEIAIVLRHQVLGLTYDPLPREDERRRPVDVSVEVGAGGTWDMWHRWYGNVHAGINVSFGTGRGVPYLSYRCHWGVYDYEEEEFGAFRYEVLFLGLEVDGTRERSARRLKIVPEVFFGRTPTWGEQGDKAWRTFGFNFVVRWF